SLQHPTSSKVLHLKLESKRFARIEREGSVICIDGNIYQINQISINISEGVQRPVYRRSSLISIEA
ncbi:MAG: hypothetical protein V4796_33035, partial [Burkholderia cenocepacia]